MNNREKRLRQEAIEGYCANIRAMEENLAKGDEGIAEGLWPTIERELRETIKWSREQIRELERKAT